MQEPIEKDLSRDDHSEPNYRKVFEYLQFSRTKDETGEMAEMNWNIREGMTLNFEHEGTDPTIGFVDHQDFGIHM